MVKVDNLQCQFVRGVMLYQKALEWVTEAHPTIIM